MQSRTWLVLAVLAALPAAAEAQTPRRQETIEIRGAVPAPQVVTIRPRELPAYNRQVLVPDFFDRDFWPSILPGYDLVPERVVRGDEALSDTATRADTVAVPLMAPQRPDTLARPMTDTLRLMPPPPREEQESESVELEADESPRRASGTAPARSAP